MARSRKRRRERLLYTLLLIVAAMGLMVLMLAGSLLLQEQQNGGESDPGAVSLPADGTVLPTTTTTVSPTTTTTQTTAQPTLLQYDPTGHYVQPAGAAWNLLLVNDWNRLPDSYDSGVTFVTAGERSQRVDSRILEDLNAMLAAGAAYGIDVQSGYRPSSQQSTLYWRQVDKYRGYGYDEEKAQQAAGTVVKRPGYSEHNTGLAVDLGGSGNFKLEADFADTAAYAWLIEHCADYGFILRFPQGKEAVTGVIYEPWHYRYVGREAAQYIMANGLCLEEYLEQEGY